MKEKKEPIKPNQKELVSLEILTFSEDVSEFTEKQLKEKYSKLEEKFTLIGDLSQPYVIRTVVGKYDEVRSLEPDMIPEGDSFEVSESIQDILKASDIPVYKSDFDQNAINNIATIKEKQLNSAIKYEMAKGLQAMNEGKINLPETIEALSDKVILENTNE